MDFTLRARVHDALLIEAPTERIEADVALMKEIMRRASQDGAQQQTLAGRTNCAPMPRSSAIRTAIRTSAAKISGPTC